MVNWLRGFFNLIVAFFGLPSWLSVLFFTLIGLFVALFIYRLIRG